MTIYTIKIGVKKVEERLKNTLNNDLNRNCSYFFFNKKTH